MDRREFLAGMPAESNKKQNFDSVARTNSGLTPYTGSWSNSEVKHLLKRTMFGSTKNDINFFLGLNMSDSVDTLLEIINHPVYAPPSPPLNSYSNIITDPLCAAGQPWPGTADTSNLTVYTYSSRKKSLKAWWISQMLNQPRSLREKMTLFWSNHFVIELDTVAISNFIYNYNVLIREFALGNFKDFTKQITLNTAMLRYLNGELSY